MQDIYDHFNTDFERWTNVAPVPTFTFPSGSTCQIPTILSLDDVERSSCIAILWPESLARADETWFLQEHLLLLTDAAQQSINTYPPFLFSKRVYLYTNEEYVQPHVKVGELDVFKRGQQYCQSMVRLSDLINGFTSDYEKNEFSCYKELAEHVETVVKTILKKNNIFAIVTSRAKDAVSLKEKLFRRAFPIETAKIASQYRIAHDIYKDIPDFSGIRIALYFPGDMEKSIELLRKRFTLIEEPIPFPSGKNRKPEGRLNNRFSGYRAKHLRIEVPETELKTSRPGRPLNVEIQIASVIMHAWAEVEHDLAYKKRNGDLSQLELDLLDQVNGLAMCGEIALERLQEARNSRIAGSQQIKPLRKAISGRRYCCDTHYNQVKAGPWVGAKPVVINVRPAQQYPCGLKIISTNKKHEQSKSHECQNPATILLLFRQEFPNKDS